MMPISQWSVGRLVRTSVVAVPAFLVSVDGMATGFHTLGEIQPFVLKSDMAAGLDAIAKRVADQLQDTSKQLQALQQSLASSRWDQAADRADKWDTDLQNMNDELVSKNVQKIAMEERLKERSDPLIEETLRDLRLRIADLERRIVDKTRKLVALKCDLERRDDPNRQC